MSCDAPYVLILGKMDFSPFLRAEKWIFLHFSRLYKYNDIDIKMMIERKIYSDLLRWKANPSHKPLLVKGQRQVGKSFIIDHFGEREYDDRILLNFHDDPGACELFSDKLDVDYLIDAIEAYTDRRVDDRKTLLMFDEIQECPRARSSFKAFSKDGRYDIIASGSLLGVTHPKKKRKGEAQPEAALPPVGFEQQIVMHSCDFEEFLWANGIPKETTESLRRDIREGNSINRAILDRFSRLFRDFMVIGGMPEPLQRYVDTKDLEEVRSIQDMILATIVDDILRYAPEGEEMKTLACYRSIPRQLSETNGKFQFSKVEGVRGKKDYKEMEENLLWIEGAGYGNFSRSLESPQLPLENFEKKNSFKVYTSDTGLLVRQYGKEASRAIMLRDTDYNLGPVFENITAECLTKSGFVPRWYRKNGGDNRMELDFVIPLKGKAAVVEIKSGNDLSATSLSKAMSVFGIRNRMMMEEDNIFTDEDGVRHYPLFASAFIDELDDRSVHPSVLTDRF